MESARSSRRRAAVVTLLAGALATTPALAQDAGRGRPGASELFRDPFFVQVETGASYATLLAVGGDRSAFPNMVTFSGWGPGVGATVGIHGLIFSVGVQVYGSFLSGEGRLLNPGAQGEGRATGSFHLVTTTLEGAFRLPMGRVELSLRVGLGHALLGGFETSASEGFPNVSADGWTARAGLGVDVRVWRRWFVGFDTDVAVANVRRDGLSGARCPTADPFCAELLREGDAVALMVHPHLQLSVHF